MHPPRYPIQSHGIPIQPLPTLPNANAITTRPPAPAPAMLANPKTIQDSSDIEDEFDEVHIRGGAGSDIEIEEIVDEEEGGGGSGSRSKSGSRSHGSRSHKSSSHKSGTHKSGSGTHRSSSRRNHSQEKDDTCTFCLKGCCSA